MNLFLPPSLALASMFAAILPIALSASPRVDSTVIGPSKAGGAYVVSNAGTHIAYTVRNGDKFAMNIDGKEGPAFDAIFKTNGAEFFFAPKAGTYAFGKRESDYGGTDAPLAFSENGEHSLYSARLGDERVVMHDGREIARFPTMTMGRPFPTLSPGGKHAYWVESRPDGARSVQRIVVDGKPADWGVSAVPVFSADDTHYAYTAWIGDSFNGKSVTYLDGKPTDFPGGNPIFSADGAVLFTWGADAQGQTFVYANGKPVINGIQVSKLVPAPVGRRFAAIVRQMEGNQPVDFLFIDGQKVPDSHDAKNVWFSPDGKRYAALCQSGFGGGKPAMLIDGDAYEFARIDPAPPYWTADSSKVIFTAGTDEGSVVVVNTAMTPYTEGFGAVVLARSGDRFVWSAATPTRGGIAVLDEKNILPPRTYPSSEIQLSADGTRYAFFAAPVGRGETGSAVIDGAVLAHFQPAFHRKWINDAMNSLQPVVFSPDGKHLAVVGRAGTATRNSLYVDETLVQPDANTAYFTTFTPDSQHLYWITLDQATITSLWVDGELAVRANGYFFREIPGAFSVDRDGVATFVAEEGDVVKRYRITPSPDTTVATLLRKETTVASDETPKPVSSPATAAKRGTAAPEAGPKAPAGASVQAPAPNSATLAAAPAIQDAPVTPLTWNDIARRPETRPLACAVTKEFRFQGGAVVRAGTPVTIVETQPAGLVVSTQDGRTTFNAKPEDTDVLAVANAAWAKLTPAQRELTVATLLRRADLWPYRVKLLVPYTLDAGRTRVGDSALLLGVENGQLLISHEGLKLLFNVEVAETDLLAQARAALASSNGLAGRVVEELNGKLVSPIDGRALALDTSLRPKLVVMYRGAGWCGPCQIFSPELVKVLKAKAPAPSDVAVIFVSADRSPAEAKAYASKLGIDWPTIYYKSRDQLPAFNGLFGDAIPQLVVTDRHGKVLIDSNQVGTARALQQLQQLM